MKRIYLVLVLISLSIIGTYYLLKKPEPPLETKFAVPEKEVQVEERETVTSVKVSQPGDYHLLKSSRQVYQTFNNCGPATLSMILSWYEVNVSQKELGDKMRPYQHPKGDNDDKTIFTSEFTDWAKKYGLNAENRVNGDLETLKLFVTNGIPVVVKTWLRVDEDIGHFRIVRGFDEGKKVIIQDDSYHGPDKKISYFDFMSMWQPFNYAYMIIYSSQKEKLVKAILKDEDEVASWKNSIVRAQKEADLDPENIYPWFNLSTAYYHTGDYQQSTQAFERVEARLPRRMLWYQIEPIRAYQALKNYDRVFEITDKLINGGNRAFSELYQIRGEIYLTQGDVNKAKEQFELALLYNKNFTPAKQALKKL